MNDTKQTTDEIARRLAKSDLFLKYRDAFLQMTGLRIFLDPVAGPRSDAAIPFVQRLRLPVSAGENPFAHVVLQPVAVHDGKHGSFDDVARAMLDEGSSAAEVRAAREVYMKLPVVNAERHTALQTLLRLFAAQLSELAEKLFLQSTDNEPLPVGRAREFILAHLNSPLALEDVARHAGVSPFHFCKIFKRSTGLTFTAFVNRARVEHAKRLLLKPLSRVTEVAFDVGFQSLSQFNRSFRRVTAQSPTEYRSRLHGRTAALVPA